MRLKAALALVATMVTVAAGSTAITSPAVAAVPIVEAADQAGVMPPPPIVTAAQTKAAFKPAGVKAPKGSPGTKSSGAETSRALAGTPANFVYGEAKQDLTGTDSATGMAVNTIISKPYLDPTDYHSLTELSVMDRTASISTKNAVEVGWTVDPALNGGSVEPHLFVFWWKNGVGQCYNGCGFVPYTPNCSVAGTKCAGSSLASDVNTQKRMEITNTGTAWWIAWNATWIGYFPNTLWTASTPSGPGVTFNKGNRFQAFGEIAYPTTKATTCSDMGNGQLGSNVTPAPIPARVGSAVITGANPNTIVANMAMAPFPASVAAAFPTAALTTTTMNYGGAGYKANGTLPGNIGSC